MHTIRLSTFSRIALGTALLAATASTFAQTADPARKQLFDQLDRELVMVEKLGQAEVSLPSYAAWKEVLRDRTEVTGTVNLLRSNPQSSVPNLERILTAVKVDNGRAKRISDAVKSLNNSTKNYAYYDSLPAAALDDASMPQMAELKKRCDSFSFEMQTMASADYVKLEGTAVAIAKDATDCSRLARELLALQSKGKELDKLKNVVPTVAQQNPVLTQIAAFADIVSKQRTLVQATDRLRRTAINGNALDDSIKQLQVMNIEAEGFARNAQGGGNARTVRVLNTLERDANVFWRAAGCAGIYRDYQVVCNNQPVKAGQTVEYQFKPGTSGRKVGFMAGSCATQETSIGQDAAGADLHVITDGCQIKPESAALSESVQKRTKYVKNNRDKPIEVAFIATGCLGGTNQGKVWVCKTVTVAAGMEAMYEFPLGTFGLGMDWGDEVCLFTPGFNRLLFKDGSRGRSVDALGCDTRSY
jgi:hypothetical protein